ncbi:hypothetical protein C0J52_21039 [Blattella germanica]|nr:hypothetical protein C0J52_21039 [Blattella germanica]
MPNIFGQVKLSVREMNISQHSASYSSYINMSCAGHRYNSNSVGGNGRQRRGLCGERRSVDLHKSAKLDSNQANEYLWILHFAGQEKLPLIYSFQGKSMNSEVGAQTFSWNVSSAFYLDLVLRFPGVLSCIDAYELAMEETNNDDKNVGYLGHYCFLQEDRRDPTGAGSVCRSQAGPARSAVTRHQSGSGQHDCDISKKIAVHRSVLSRWGKTALTTDYL